MKGDPGRARQVGETVTLHCRDIPTPTNLSDKEKVKKGKGEICLTVKRPRFIGSWWPHVSVHDHHHLYSLITMALWLMIKNSLSHIYYTIYFPAPYHSFLILLFFRTLIIILQCQMDVVWLGKLQWCRCSKLIMISFCFAVGAQCSVPLALASAFDIQLQHG